MTLLRTTRLRRWPPVVVVARLTGTEMPSLRTIVHLYTVSTDGQSVQPPTNLMTNELLTVKRLVSRHDTHTMLTTNTLDSFVYTYIRRNSATT